eukprot:tig00021035_g17244.t1
MAFVCAATPALARPSAVAFRPSTGALRSSSSSKPKSAPKAAPQPNRTFIYCEAGPQKAGASFSSSDRTSQAGEDRKVVVSVCKTCAEHCPEGEPCHMLMTEYSFVEQSDALVDQVVEPGSCCEICGERCPPGDACHLVYRDKMDLIPYDFDA